MGALVKASGDAGGGDIRIGGDRQGKGPGPNADSVVLAPEAQVVADATGSGKGGSIIVYGERTATIDGILTARGGPQGGDGGFIETSGREAITIAANTLIDASAPAGQPGTWLIDPTDIRIVSALTGTGANQILASSIVTALQGGSSVTIATTDTAPITRPPDHPSVTGDNTAGDGNITVAANVQPDLAGSSGNQFVLLTLTADRDVTIENGVTIGVTEAGGADSMRVLIEAGNDITNNGIIDVSGSLGGNVVLTATRNVALGRINVGVKAITITATGGAITDNNPRLKSDGSEEENLVGEHVRLTAGGNIGGPEDADIDIDAINDNYEPKTNGDNVFINVADTSQTGGGGDNTGSSVLSEIAGSNASRDTIISALSEIAGNNASRDTVVNALREIIRRGGNGVDPENPTIKQRLRDCMGADDGGCFRPGLRAEVDEELLTIDGEVTTGTERIVRPQQR